MSDGVGRYRLRRTPVRGPTNPSPRHRLSLRTIADKALGGDHHQVDASSRTAMTVANSAPGRGRARVDSASRRSCSPRVGRNPASQRPRPRSPWPWLWPAGSAAARWTRPRRWCCLSVTHPPAAARRGRRGPVVPGWLARSSAAAATALAVLAPPASCRPTSDLNDAIDDANTGYLPWCVVHEVHAPPGRSAALRTCWACLRPAG